MEQNIESQDIGAQNNPPGWEDAKSGFKLGLLLSSVYASIPILLFIISSIYDAMLTRSTSGSLQTDLHSLLSFLLLFLILSIIVVFISAIFPSAFIGAVTGLCIGAIAKSNFGRRTSKCVFIILSFLVCGSIATLIHILFGIKIILSLEPSNSGYLFFGIFETYPFLIGIPTIIYTLAGGWFAWKTHSKFKIS